MNVDHLPGLVDTLSLSMGFIAGDIDLSLSFSKAALAGLTAVTTSALPRSNLLSPIGDRSGRAVTSFTVPVNFNRRTLSACKGQ